MTDQQRLDEAVVNVLEAGVDGSTAVLRDEEGFDLGEEPCGVDRARVGRDAIGLQNIDQPSIDIDTRQNITHGVRARGWRARPMRKTKGVPK